MSVVLNHKPQSSWDRIRRVASKSRLQTAQPGSFHAIWQAVLPFISIALLVGLVTYLYLG
jgi:hypothetical protein